ncbi:MAG: glycosyltransferase [Candidatus Sabulitectum sp.]|nr:glycosyltransferase [Candidatus Sabulitectum sp.]
MRIHVAAKKRIHYKFWVFFHGEGIVLAAFLVVIIWVSVGMILLPMVVYPVVIFLLGLFFSRREGSSFQEYPFVSVMIAARNEEKCIGERLQNLLEQDYPKDRIEILVASDVSTDRTDEIIKSFEKNGVYFLRIEKRLGKSALMVELSKIAKGEILVFTDANTQFNPNTVRELVDPFADPAVGCVDGSKQNSLDSITCESIYWRYEQMLKALGSKIGAVLGATGAVFAVRKSLYNPPDPARADDFETAVSTRVQGYACLYNHRAIAAEPTPTDSIQYHRLVRIVSWMIGSAFSLFGKAVKRKRYGLALQLAVHKILRWNMGIFAIIASIAGGLLAVYDSPTNYLFVSVTVFNMVALAGKLSGNKMPSSLRLPYFFWLMCLASLSGVARSLTSSAVSVWDHSAR